MSKKEWYRQRDDEMRMSSENKDWVIELDRERIFTTKQTETQK